MTGSFNKEVTIDEQGHILPDQPPQPLDLENDEIKVRRLEAWVFQVGGGACVASVHDPKDGVAGWELNPKAADYFGDRLTPGEATGMGLSVSEKQDGGLRVSHWTTPITLKYAEAKTTNRV